MKNLDLALHIARELHAHGVREVCLCAGARNSPLVIALDAIGAFRKFHFFEERSAAFFALGRMKSTGTPVAVVTTSGTAAAELLPAMVEAHYSALPLIAVTADRPRRYRGTGAPQSIEQVGIFGSYAQDSLDLEPGEDHGLWRWTRRAPAHLNVCFDEPLLDREFDAAEFSAPEPSAAAVTGWTMQAYPVLDEFLSSCRRPLVVVSALVESARAPVTAFLRRLGAPVHAEAVSGLRGRTELEPLFIRSDRSLERGQFDAVLRIGGVPTLRYWRDLEAKLSHLPVLSISDAPFAGSTRSVLLHVPLEEFFSSYPLRAEFNPSAHEELFALDRSRSEALDALLAREPDSEPGIFRGLSRAIPDGSRVYLGNSLPIREWNLAARDGRLELAVNRGANGIDGQVSTFLGFSEPGAASWGIFGDLTAMYDLVGPWILKQRADLAVQLAVINNGGGRIFSRMFGNPVFENPHGVRLKAWAELWGMEYLGATGVPAGLGPSRANRLIEIFPDPEATSRFWRDYDALWKG